MFSFASPEMSVKWKSLKIDSASLSPSEAGLGDEGSERERLFQSQVVDSGHQYFSPEKPNTIKIAQW